MSSVDIPITRNDKPLLRPGGFDELSLNQRVVVENYLRFALKSLEMKRSETKKKKGKKEEKSIEQFLIDTAQEIRTCGPALTDWLDSDKQHKYSRKMQLDSALSQFLKTTVLYGVTLQRMSKEQWHRSVNETLIWLVYTHVSLAHALLVICAYSTKKLDGYALEEIIFIFEYVADNQELLHCEALETEAKKLLDLRPNRTSPQYGLHLEKFSTTFSDSPLETDNIETRSKTPAPSEAQFATKKRKRDSPISELDGLNSNFGGNDLTAISSTTQYPSSPTVLMQQLSPKSSQLLSLLAAFGGVKVPRLLFDRYLKPQLRWNEDGSIACASFDPESDISLREQFEPATLTASLEELASGTWICVDDCDKKWRSYSILEVARESSARLLGVKGHQYWSLLALQLACHVFPRAPALEESFQTHGKALAPVIDHAFKQGKPYDLPKSTKVALAEVLIAKARLGQSHYHEKALEDATELLGNDVPDHIQASIALRRSTIARLRGDYRKSEDVIIDYQTRHQYHGLPNARLRSLIRLVLISHLENLVQLEDYENAEKGIDDFKYWEPSKNASDRKAWEPSSDIIDVNDWEPIGGAQWSPMELSVSFKKWSTIAKIYQARGRLKDARSYLHDCYPLMQIDRLKTDPIRFQIICRLADLLCAEGRCADARPIIESEIQSVSNHNHGKFAKALRRLKVSLVDVDIAEGRYDQASMNIKFLKQEFSTISSPNISDQWLHVRSLVASARLLHYQCRFQDAVSEWEQALLLLTRYPKSFEPEGFFYGLCHLSISLARIRTTQSTRTASPSWHAGARHAFDKGCDALVREDMNYWIPILPETVIPKLLSDIESAAPTWIAKNDEDDVFLRVREKYSRRSLSHL